jgi:Tfp pilus assembly PilM family ATPase
MIICNDYMSFYREHATHIHGPDGAIGQVILCGGDSLLLNLPQVLSEKLNLPVKMGNPLINLLPDDKKKRSASEKEIVMPKRESFVYTTAIGLALRDFM